MQYTGLMDCAGGTGSFAHVFSPDSDSTGDSNRKDLFSSKNSRARRTASTTARGVTVAPVDHHVTKSLYFSDPDGNALELYADGTDDWKNDPDLLFSPVGKLEL